MKIPYFLSAQLDGTQDQIGKPTNTARLEGWIGLFVFNASVWVAVVVMDIHLLVYGFKVPDTQVHLLQTAALTTVSISAITILVFTALHYCNKDRPFATKILSNGRSQSAELLPPFATALIAGGLRATLGFSYLILLSVILLNHIPDEEWLKILIAQVCLKTFGSSMALANARLRLFSPDAQGAE